MQNSQNQRFGANQIESSTSTSGVTPTDYSARVAGTTGGTTSGLGTNALQEQSSYAGAADRTQAGTYGSSSLSSGTISSGSTAMGGTSRTASSYGTGGTTNEFAASQPAQNTGRMTGYGTASSASTPAANSYTASNLTQAGVSNFSQQVNNAYQHLQKVQRELVQAQNQIEVQAQAQARQLKQLQQLIETAGNEVQQIDSMARMQRTGGNYPLS
jgi:hypothetical protein